MEEGDIIPPSNPALNDNVLQGPLLNTSSGENSTDALILPAYIAYTSFVLFRFILISIDSQ